MDFIDTIAEALLLIESGDTMFHIGPTQNMELGDYHKKHNIIDHKEYDLDHGAGGKLIIYHRDGEYELHHQIDHEGVDVSGKVVSNKTDVIKFYGTMKTVGTRILNSGNSVKIVGNHTNGMFQKYNRMANIFAKQNGHTVSQPKQYTLDSPASKDYSEITIKKKAKNIVSEINFGITLARTKSEIMGYNGGNNSIETELDRIMKGINDQAYINGD